MWPAEAAYKAVMKGKQDPLLPPIGQGFNRSLELTNFCGLPAPLDAAKYDCVAPGSMSATLKDGLNSTSGLKFGGATCSLSGIKVYKKAAEVEALLQFTGCSGGYAPSFGAAAIAVRLEKAATGDFNILPWMKQVEGNCIGAPVPPSGPSTIDLGVTTKAEVVGAGQCAGVAKSKKTGGITQAQCQSLCAGEIVQGHDTPEATCTGFSYKLTATGKEGDEHCLLYNTNVSDLASKDGNWTCYKMEVLKDKKAAQKVTDKVVEAYPLKLDELLSTVPEAFVQVISPPAASPKCFEPLAWFTLENKAAQPAVLHVPEAEWEELVGLLKETPTSTSAVSSPQVLDRVIFNPCGSTPGWGSQTCSGVGTATSAKGSQCKQEETINSIVTGCLSSIGTWIVVGIVYRLLKVAPSSNQYDQLVDSEKPPASCSPTLLLILCGVAVGGAILCSWASTYLLNAIMRSDSCLDFDEVLVAILSSMLATAIAVVLSLWFLAKQYPNQPHPLLGNKPLDLPKSSKLLLVEVPDGSSQKALGFEGKDIMASGGSFTSQMPR